MRSTESRILARQQSELEYLRQYKRTTINHLASLLDVSSMTVTRDLHMFIKKGMVIHDYGQVVWVGSLHQQAKISPSRTEAILEKFRKPIPRAHRIMINASPITESIIELLIQQNIQILTNQLITNQKITDSNLVLMTGGHLNHLNQNRFFSGDIAVNTIRHEHSDLALIYATGLSAHNLTTLTLAQSIVDRTMIECVDTAKTFLSDNATDHESNFMIVKSNRIARLI